VCASCIWTADIAVVEKPFPRWVVGGQGIAAVVVLARFLGLRVALSFYAAFLSQLTTSRACHSGSNRPTTPYFPLLLQPKPTLFTTPSQGNWPCRAGHREIGNTCGEMRALRKVLPSVDAARGSGSPHPIPAPPCHQGRGCRAHGVPKWSLRKVSTPNP